MREVRAQVLLEGQAGIRQVALGTHWCQQTAVAAVDARMAVERAGQVGLVVHQMDPRAVTSARPCFLLERLV